ncbi:MAG: hypothetical protein NTX42_11480 [Methanothrix sp.]|nr:hypothetical protein [Methanothrix sp.]
MVGIGCHSRPRPEETRHAILPVKSRRAIIMNSINSKGHQTPGLNLAENSTCRLFPWAPGKDLGLYASWTRGRNHQESDRDVWIRERISPSTTPWS